MGIEPTARGERATGFEDQGSHQAPFTSGCEKLSRRLHRIALSVALYVGGACSWLFVSTDYSQLPDIAFADGDSGGVEML